MIESVVAVLTLRLIVELVSVQLPMLLVTQLALPPTVKLPLIVTLGTTALVAMSYTVTVPDARQPLFPALTDVPTIDFTAMVLVAGGGGGGGGGGDDSPSEYTSRFGAAPIEFGTKRFAVALEVMDAATTAGVAVGFAANVSTATPATCGEAIDVPLRMLTAL